ncbi:unnamed protein product, partial [Ectocarpus sp. 6 AP-2014]
MGSMSRFRISSTRGTVGPLLPVINDDRINSCLTCITLIKREESSVDTPGAHGRRRTIGLVLRDTGRATRMCAVPTAVQHLLR